MQENETSTSNLNVSAPQGKDGKAVTMIAFAYPCGFKHVALHIHVPSSLFLIGTSEVQGKKRG